MSKVWMKLYQHALGIPFNCVLVEEGPESSQIIDKLWGPLKKQLLPPFPDQIWAELDLCS